MQSRQRGLFILFIQPGKYNRTDCQCAYHCHYHRMIACLVKPEITACESCTVFGIENICLKNINYFSENLLDSPFAMLRQRCSCEVVFLLMKIRDRDIVNLVLPKYLTLLHKNNVGWREQFTEKNKCF